MSEEQPVELAAHAQAEATATGELKPINVANSFVNLPTVYADACLFAQAVGPNIRLTFVETIFAPEGIPEAGSNARHVGHLVMPKEGFLNMMKYLTESAKRMGWVDDAAGN